MNMPSGNNLSITEMSSARRAIAIAIATVLIACASILVHDDVMSTASAVEEERSISFYNIHNKETITITYKKDGRYIPSAMDKLNHFLRDWRQNEPIKMDPKLIDLIWELRQELGSTAPTHLISGYRSPKTNAMLRRIGRKVARRSMHMVGKASDVYFPDVTLKDLRNSALVRQMGGVGYYPRSGERGFVHVDTGKVRHWPRLSKTRLAGIFKNHKRKSKHQHQHRQNNKGPIYLAQRNRATNSTTIAASAINIGRNQTARAYPLPQPKPVLIAEAPGLTATTVSATLSPQVPSVKRKPVVLASLTPAATVEVETEEVPKLRRSLVFFPLAILRREARAEQLAPEPEETPVSVQQVTMITAATQQVEFTLADDRPNRPLSASQMARVARQVVTREGKSRLLMTSHARPVSDEASKGELLTSNATVIDLRGPTSSKPTVADIEETIAEVQEVARSEEIDTAGDVPVAIPAGASFSLR